MRSHAGLVLSVWVAIAFPSSIAAHPVCKDPDRVDAYIAAALEALVLVYCPDPAPGQMVCEAAGPALFELQSKLEERFQIAGKRVSDADIESYCEVLDEVVDKHSKR
jgi:hypothetical protein